MEFSFTVEDIVINLTITAHRKADGLAVDVNSEHISDIGNKTVAELLASSIDEQWVEDEDAKLEVATGVNPRRKADQLYGR